MFKAINCLPLFNEIWALKLRLDYEMDFFDHFIIVESTKTFAGKEKILYFEKYMSHFDRYLDRITYVVVDDMPEPRKEVYLATQGREAPENRWPLERYQRNCIKRGIARVISKIDSNTLICVQDVDEIADIGVLKNIQANGELNTAYQFMLRDYRRTVARNGKQQNLFKGGYAARYQLISNQDLHFLRWITDIGNGRLVPSGAWQQSLSENESRQTIMDTIPLDMRVIRVPNAGWHLSNMDGGVGELLKFKIQNFAHSESAVGQVPLPTDLDYYEMLQKGISFHSYDYDKSSLDENLPDFIKNKIMEFPVLLQPNK